MLMCVGWSLARGLGPGQRSLDLTMDRRVLILTYEFPPSGGGGVQRVAKFARYLPSHGWTPTVVCAEPVHGRALDESLAAEVEHVRVVRTPARHVATAVARAIAPAKRTVRPQNSAPTALVPPTAARRPPVSSRIARWVAVPDDAAYWVGPAVRAAVRLGEAEGSQVVLASGPPHSVLLAGSRVARRLGVPFVADMRDAWRDNPVAWWPTPMHERRALAAERGVLRSADMVLAVSEPIAAEAREMGAREVMLLPNGFDPGDLPVRTPDPEGPLRAVFMGTVYRGHSDPEALLKAMSDAIGRGADIVLDLVGSVSSDVADAVRNAGLDGRVVLHGYLPHAEALGTVAVADVGLVLIADRPGAKASLTGKLYEYLGMGIPVLVFGPPNGAAATLVAEAKAGWAVAPEDIAGLSSLIQRLASAKKAGEMGLAPDRALIGQFDRRQQAQTLAGLLDRVTTVS